MDHSCTHIYWSLLSNECLNANNNILVDNFLGLFAIVSNEI